MAAENMTITEALTMIKAQGDKLKECYEQLAKWKLEFSFETDPTTLEVKIKALKPFGGGGVIRTLTKEDILHYANDMDTLIREVAEQFYEVLLKKQIFEELAPGARRVLENTASIAKRTV
jgi:hypothetical protein